MQYAFQRHGGPADFANLVLVCNKCHHNIHDDNWQVAQHLDTGLRKTKPPTDPIPDSGVDSTRPLEGNPVLRN